MVDSAGDLLVFDDGNFSEDSTFLISQWFAHVPRDALAKNFGVPESAFAHIPEKQLYIFNAPVPPPLAADMVADPLGVPNPFVPHDGDDSGHHSRWPGARHQQQGFQGVREYRRGLYRNRPGGMRELHWHPTSPEWQYYISGRARMTVFGSGENSRTFDYQAGDVGYVPRTMGHYIENAGDEPVRYLEMFTGPRYTDGSLQQ